MTPAIASIVRRVLLAAAVLLLLPLWSGNGINWRYGAAVAEPSGTSEKEAFEAAKALGTVEAWDAFLSNYPKGFHADLARAYVKQLAGTGPAAPASAPAPATAAPPPAAGIPLEAASERPCKEAQSLRSERSKEPAKIRFVNESGAARVIQWIDFNGGLKEYAVLQPGAELLQETYITHPWIAAYQEGSCSQLFLPGDGTTIARLLPDGAIGRSTQTTAPAKKRASDDDEDDHGPTPEQTCKNIGKDYNGSECVSRKTTSKPSKATIRAREKASCADIGMAYINGKCAPKTKAERNVAKQKKNLPCPAGMYRNPNGQCQPNETGG